MGAVPNSPVQHPHLSPEDTLTDPLPSSQAGVRRMARLLAAAGLAVAVALPVTASAAPVGRAPVPAAVSSTQSPGTAQVWATTTDGASRLTLRGTSSARTASSSSTAATLTLDTGVTGQSVTGFGAALTHSSAELLMALPAAERQRVLVELFDPAGPVRLSVLRVPLGASDFVVGSPFTYDDTPGNKPDWSLSRFSTAKDTKALRPVLQQIKRIAPDLVVVASPWSAPAWLKASGSLKGGRLRADTRAVPTYAEYLVRALRDFRAAGVPIDVLTVQNEPQTRSFADYPRMDMPAAQQVAVINALVPRLEAAELRVRILGFDHNWVQHPGDVASVPAGGDAEDDYALRVLRSSAGASVAGTAFHCYYGDASAQEPVHAAFPDKEIWVTECSGSHGPTDTPSRYFADTLAWQSKNLMIASLRHWATSVMTWNLALDPSGGPHSGGCTTCTGVVTVDNGRVTPNAEYYVLAHASRFLPPGSVRVASTMSAGALTHVAFRAPDGTIAVLVQHGGWSALPLTITVAGTAYDVAIPPRSTSTVRIAP